MTDTQYRPTEDVREHARKSALAGREIFCNPHIGSDAEVWFAAYRAVPEALRGSQPELRPKATRVRWKRRTMAEAGIKALGHRTLKGSTPKPWAVAGAGL